jgi:hypothetical protein
VVDGVQALQWRKDNGEVPIPICVLPSELQRSDRSVRDKGEACVIRQELNLRSLVEGEEGVEDLDRNVTNATAKRGHPGRGG